MIFNNTLVVRDIAFELIRYFQFVKLTHGRGDRLLPKGDRKKVDYKRFT